MSFPSSVKLAWGAMMADKGTQGTSASDTNIHAMLGVIGTDSNGQSVYQTADQGLQAINNILATAPLPIAVHTSQDAATPLHYLNVGKAILPSITLLGILSPQLIQLRMLTIIQWKPWQIVESRPM